ncbi:hypothetical protein CLOSTASPAR_06191 [[Clostridium] asparagiforme DSM 15981]|uniref:Uncharacterized protein n=1 Tax=[Clostridium] asparagiforme DSM 15981 TaxID=518636 RepID=C0DA88_9FIRM|nr:hypothetical protein CLOSTASPAR_06191 [[Clostridium] asparagiforme DSM 15981]
MGYTSFATGNRMGGRPSSITWMRQRTGRKIEGEKRWGTGRRDGS